MYYSCPPPCLSPVSSVRREGACKKTHVLKLNTTGKFALNVVDNLVVVHHQSSQVSIWFVCVCVCVCVCVSDFLFSALCFSSWESVTV